MEDVNQWHRKNSQLNQLKKKFKAQMARFNMLRCDYSDWFMRQHSSFLYAVKSMQVHMGSLVPQTIRTMVDYRAIVDMTRTKQASSGRQVPGANKMETFIGYWERFVGLKYELDVLMDDMRLYVQSISTLREPQVKEQMDKLHDDLNVQSSEGYNFSELHNASDNLYTYRVNLPDQKFLGFSGYMPYLLTVATRLCFLCTRINLERE